MGEFHEARLYQRLADDAVRCDLCVRHCTIAPGRTGFCYTRRNEAGRLVALNYPDVPESGGLLAAVESRPIEIKPFFHFYPGSTALTYAGRGCNLRCAWCQNDHLSRSVPDPKRDARFAPHEIVGLALTWGNTGICASFSEPTLLHEFNRETVHLARAANLYTCYVSNGLLTPGALRELADAGLDAIKIDVKGDDAVYQEHCQGPGAGPVWATAHLARALGVHVEIVHLVIPGVNDSAEALASLIARHMAEVGSNTPLHFTRYSPAGGFSAPATPVATLERAWEMARLAGVRFPYLGNVPGHPAENTCCPACRAPLIERWGVRVRAIHLTATNTCPHCGETIPIVRRL